MHLKYCVWVLMKEETATAGKTCARAEASFRIILVVWGASDGELSLFERRAAYATQGRFSAPPRRRLAPLTRSRSERG
jgi:hypothetical protein